MSNSSWQVQSFYVNVGNGDCSIHILEYRPSIVQKPLAYKCVLVDGGSAWLPIDVGTGTAGTNPLRNMIAHLNALYRWVNGYCQFDTIVLTHWDEDHYGNLLWTIKEDAVVYAGFPPYLKYDNSRLPLTYFYVPNWHSDTGLNGPSWYYMRATRGYAYINRSYERGRRTTAFDFVPFAILRAADSSLKDVLGAEFFFNTPCRGAISDVQDLSSLVRANPPTGPYINPTDTTPPSMYCIGVCQVVPGTPSVSVIKENPTRTNKFSIAFIILWTDTWRISHFSAGDADQDTEHRILAWLTKNHPGTMTSVKISHHGSRSSTPLSLFPTAMPRNIVMSIPSGMHRHPTLEVMWYLWLWTVSSGSRPAVLGTKYPHFFAVHPAAGRPNNLWYYTKADRISVSFLERWDQTKYAPYWQDCNTRGAVINTFMAAGQSVQSLLYQYWAIKQAYGLNEDQMRPFVVNQLEKVWLTICHPSPVSHPSVGQGYVWPTRVPITRSNQIEAVRIQGRNDNLDGLVYHLYRGTDFFIPYFGSFTTQLGYNTGVVGTLANGAAVYAYFFPWHLDPRHGPRVSPKAGGPADAQDFYSESAAVVAGREANPPGTDLNEDDDVLPDPQDVGEGTPPPPYRLPLPGAVEVSALAGEDGGYYLYASIVSAAAIRVAAAQYSILSAGPLNSFLSALHCANLCLVGPNPPGPTGTTPLLESDEFGHYLTAALNAQAVSAINAPQSYVGGFSFAVAPISGSPSDKAVLSFTTAAVEDAFGLAKGTGPPMGILEDVKTLVFGLDTSVWDPATTVTATASLMQLVQFAGITYLEKSPAVAYLSDIQLAIPLSAAGKRNAVWFEPLSSYRTTTRLEMDLSSDAVGRLNQYIAAFAGLSIVSAFAIARRTSIWTPAAPKEGVPASASATISYGGSLTFGGDFTISSGTHFDAAIELMPTQISLVLTLRDKVDILADIFTLLKPVLGLQGDHFEFRDWLKGSAGSTSFQPPYIRRIVAVMDHEAESKGGTPSTPGMASVQIVLETRVNFSGGAFALFLITYTWTREAGGTSSSQLEAELWPAPLSADAATYSPTLLPGYEGYRSLLPPVTLGPNEQWPLSLDLTKIGGFDHLPSEINPEVTQVTLMINSSGISFSGDVVAGAPNGDIPKVSLAQLNLDASYLFGSAGGFSGSLNVMALIEAAPHARNGLPAQITGEVWNDGTGWKLGAGVHNLYGSTLYQFFDSDTQGGIGPVLDNLEIRELVIEYDYHPSGGASSFSISGNIAFGTLALSLAFTCASPSSWVFKAALDTSEVPETGTTLGQVLHQIFGAGGVEDDLPDCILDVPVNPPQSEDAVGLDMVRVAGPAGSTGSGLFFTAWLQFDGMAFQALQYQGPTPQGASERPPPRRVFTMSVSSLPTASVPLVGDIAQPFDDMLLLYVQRLDGPGGSADDGITYAELQTINTELAAAGRSQLPYRVTKKTYADTDVVLPVGAHFLLVLKGDGGQPQVALDYVFWTPAASLTGAPTTLTVRKDETPAIIRTPREKGAQDASADPGTAKVPCERKMGPLAIRNIGFKYSDDGQGPTLSILMDASVVLGPIGLGLLGFSLDLHFTKGMTLLQLPTPSVSLGGLAVSFDRSPVVLGGMFEHFVVSKPGPPPVQLDYYQGAAALSFEPYLFQADGYYGETVSAAGKFKSAFVYFVLGGPLVTLELAQIDDVTGGFGYNTSLRLPSVTNVEQFPFLQGVSGSSSSSSSTDPNAALASLTNSGWFFPQDGSFWLAAGLHMLALEMLQASAVVVVEWNPDIVLGVYGVATADMPAGNSSAKVVHVELGLVGTFTFKDGTLKIEGQLAPSSFVLDPACHVTGGFALYQWFGSGGRGADGDFVFTVGGYHRGFDPPAQYPNPPRLAISWTLDDALSIRGEAYFAMTPNLCMAGGRLDASLSLGPLSAWFDAYADMLINFKPFFFSADGGVSVGVGFTLNLWICTVHISCEVAANLHLQGPSIAGTVYVNFWVFGFSIEFGSSQDASGRDNPLSLPDFYRLALQADLSQQKGLSPLLPYPAVGHERDDAAAEDSDLPPPHVYTCNEGLVPSGNAASTPSAPDEQWHVRGAVFQFTVGLGFAIDKATVVTAQADPSAPAIPPFDVPLAGDPVYARPMHLTEPLSSTITVTITPPKGTSPNQPRWDVASGVVKAVPKGLWGVYSPSTDPLNPSTADPNRIPALLHPSDTGSPSSPNTTLTHLTTALTVSSPAPALSKDWIPAFNYADYFNRDAGSGHFPARDAADVVFYPVPIGSPAAAAAEWEVVRSQWAGVPGFGAGAGEKAVELWMGLGAGAKEGWLRVGGEKTSSSLPMTGAAPTGILLVEGVFEEWYLEAPRMAGYGC